MALYVYSVFSCIEVKEDKAVLIIVR
jgi:hypothetical protein